MIEEVIIILDNLLYNNDKYLINHILGYVYPKCYICKEFFNDNKVFNMYDGTFVCIYHFTKLIYKKCHSCDKYYEFEDNIYCRSCLGSCRIYCPNCLSLEYHRGFNPNRQLSILDDILLNVANRLNGNFNIEDID